MDHERLLCLAQMLHSFAAAGEPVSAESVALAAHAIEALLPQIQAMESRPVPPRFRVLQGGRGSAA
jgi:hypothetical protein